jgi:hypothetical protein
VPSTPRSNGEKPKRTPEEIAQSKVDAFKKVASKRLTNAVHAIESVGKTANQKTYTFTPEQAEQVKVHLLGAVEKVVEAFSQPTDGSGTRELIQL